MLFTFTNISNRSFTTGIYWYLLTGWLCLLLIEQSTTGSNATMTDAQLLRLCRSQRMAVIHCSWLAFDSKDMWSPCFLVTSRAKQPALSADAHRGRDLFVSQDWDGLIIAAGALDPPLISESGRYQSLCIHVRNTSPVVIACQLHYLLLVDSLWHCYKPESHGPVFIELLASLSSCCT